MTDRNLLTVGRGGGTNKPAENTSPLPGPAKGGGIEKQRLVPRGGKKIRGKCKQTASSPSPRGTHPLSADLSLTEPAMSGLSSIYEQYHQKQKKDSSATGGSKRPPFVKSRFVYFLVVSHAIPFFRLLSVFYIYPYILRFRAVPHFGDGLRPWKKPCAKTFRQHLPGYRGALFDWKAWFNERQQINRTTKYEQH